MIKYNNVQIVLVFWLEEAYYLDKIGMMLVDYTK
jgi:hypothetical protein